MKKTKSYKIKLLIVSTFLFYLLPKESQCQIHCDSVRIMGTSIDQQLQQDFLTLEADTILLYNHCYSTNGCGDQVSFLAWNLAGTTYVKSYHRKRNRVKVKNQVSKSKHRVITRYFDQHLYLESDSIISPYFADDGPATLIVFKTANHCRAQSFGLNPFNHKTSLWASDVLNAFK